jgi:integrase
LKRVREVFKGYRALAVTSQALLNYVAKRQREKAANATINRELEAIRRAFVLAVEAGTLSFVPKVPRSGKTTRQGFFEKGEFEAVIAALGDSDLQDFCEWSWRTGMRPGESRSLTWAGFDRETYTVRLHAKDAKTGHGRIIPVAGALRPIIERRLAVQRLDCPLIFHRQARAVGDFRKRWKTACASVGVKGKLPYDLRRTAVRNMVRADLDRGHADQRP